MAERSAFPTLALRKRLREAYRELLGEVNATHFLTFNFGRTTKPDTALDRLKGFCAALESAHLGRTWNKQPAHKRLLVIGFPEHLETNTHWHALARIPEEMSETLDLEGEGIWKKYAKSGQLYIIKKNREKAAEIYSTKKLHRGGAIEWVFIYVPDAKVETGKV